MSFAVNGFQSWQQYSSWGKTRDPVHCTTSTVHSSARKRGWYTQHGNASTRAASLTAPSGCSRVHQGSFPHSSSRKQRSAPGQLPSLLLKEVVECTRAISLTPPPGSSGVHQGSFPHSSRKQCSAPEQLPSLLLQRSAFVQCPPTDQRSCTMPS